MSRQTYLLGVGIVLVAGAFLLTDRVLYPSRPTTTTPGLSASGAAATLRNASRVRKGMTLKQVEALLGPGECFQEDWLWAYRWTAWTGTSGVQVMVWIGFGRPSGEVMRVAVRTLTRRQTGGESLSARLRAWLGQ
jgi:hypothetical protein